MFVVWNGCVEGGLAAAAGKLQVMVVVLVVVVASAARGCLQPRANETAKAK